MEKSNLYLVMAHSHECISIRDSRHFACHNHAAGIALENNQIECSRGACVPTGDVCNYAGFNFNFYQTPLEMFYSWYFYVQV